MYNAYFKRILDILFTVVLLVLTSWIFLLIALAYMLTFQFPILFRQNRIGKDEISFELLKFRTLKDNDLPLERRKFALGNFLRLTSLDELPQLMHVLRGEMSLIGPRPLPVEYLPLFSDEQRLRHQVRPGITGWAQVNGRNSIPWKEKFQLDLEYVRNISFMLDCKISIRTILLLLSFRKDVSLEEEKFSGKNNA